MSDSNFYSTKHIDALSLEVENIKNTLETLDDKINQIITKLDEFTLFLHDEDDDEDSYNSEWSPYSDENGLYDEDFYEDEDDE